MSDATETMAERHSRLLGELAEMGMAVVRDLKGRMAKAEGLAEAQGLALAFHRVSRSVRQTLALESKLEREHRQGAVEARADEARVRAHRIHQRELRLKKDLGRAIWNEFEPDEAQDLLNELHERVRVDARLDDFADGPIEDHIARLREDLGLPARDEASDPFPPSASRLAGEAGLSEEGRMRGRPDLSLAQPQIRSG